MRTARSHLFSALCVLRRDFQLALSYRLQLASSVLAGFLTLTIFYYVSRLVHVAAFDSPDEYYAFVVVGIVILQMLNSVMVGPPLVLRQELVAGTFERIVLSPFGPVAGLASLMLFPVVLALVTGALMLCFGVIVFGVDLEPSTSVLAIPVAVLGALAFAPFGALLVAVVLIVKQAALGATWVTAAISLVAGLYFPVALLPGWIEWASNVQPFTPAVDLLRHLLVGTSLSDPVWLDLVKLLGFTAATLPAALAALAAAVGFARRRGTIIEY